MRILTILALAIPLIGCGTLTVQSATKTEGDLIIAQMAAQTSFNAAKPKLSASQITVGQKALDQWLAALEAADKARIAADNATEATQLTAAATAQAAETAAIK